ncbi:Caspase domain protein [Anatilimnocola aggregata]|uniref:Caspase domain protein n=1 Tax=Anatilimnocola aggregata TaxID=2528021 RepID=A0A517Y4J3_9BACT|nr:DUF4384 domain-containing protein [Anatilimnocola aggregata]QDU25100.1 Caspase domain protein [Anatilimnocola aggregata]
MISRKNRLVFACSLLFTLGLPLLIAVAQQPAPPMPPTEQPAAVPPSPGDSLVPTRPAFLMNVAVNRADPRYSHGERLAVRFKAETDCHVYLLYHQADGSTVMLFPNKAQPDTAVKANVEVSIPKAGDDFRFRIAAPYGKEAMQVIASKKRIELLDKLDASAGRAVAVSQATQDELAKLIKASADQFAEHRVVLQTQAAGGALPASRPPLRAGLFVGVNKLKATKHGDEAPQARGSAELMHKSMTTLGGVAPEHARVLTDTGATTASFEEAMTKWLPSITQPGDTVFLFYCGHGGPEPTDDPAEIDGMDEVITTYDKFVVDDQLGRWLQELPGRQIVMLMETCHGGGLVDARSLTGSIHDVARRVHDISQLNTIVVTACLPDEFSSFSKDLPAAFMPIYFDEAMRTLPRPVSVQAAFQHYRRKLRATIGADQEPVLLDNILLPVPLVLAGAAAKPAPQNTAPQPQR